MNVPSETPVTTSQADPLRSRSIRKLSAFEVGFSRISGRSCGRSELSIPEWAGRMWVRTTVSALKERVVVREWYEESSVVVGDESLPPMTRSGGSSGFCAFIIS